MVPIKEAINSGLWLHCEHTYGYNTYQFRLKLNFFKILNLNEVDDPEEIAGLDENSKLYMLDIEVINTNKEPIALHSSIDFLLLVDQDDFKFPIFKERHLYRVSEFGKKHKLQRFDFKELLPKIKAVGSIIFQLPDDDDAQYSLSIQNEGIVQEV